MIEITKKHANILVVVNGVRPAVADLKVDVATLEMTFTYHSEVSCLIHAEGSDYIDKVKAFYARFW
ncbi:hypothetical protein F442_02206, partial [Phytophthora nicotianae P10297]